MTDQDFDFIRAALKDRCAIALEPGKEYLVESRLAPIVRELHLASISQLVVRLREPAADALWVRVIEAMVTTETSFFRDVHPFEAIRKVVLPDLIERRRVQRSLSIWCAASATGQEPYSLAILIREYFPELLNWDLHLLATDLSPEMLARAKQGRYNQHEVSRGLSAALLEKHFERRGAHWHLAPSIRNMVMFQELNLATSWPVMRRIDFVLLRNVLIYFDNDAKKTILNRLAKLLQPDGYLLLGGAETTLNLDESYRRIEHLKTSLYQLVADS
jgi:chemotaxis protein methyltransferase CheR